MTGARRRSVGAGEAARRRHAWLELVQTSGPFLTLPVVDRAFPNGMPEVPGEVRAGVRSAVARMLEDRGASRQAVIVRVLCDALGWGDHLRQGAELPDTLTEAVAEHGTVVRPAFAFVEDRHDSAAGATAGDDDNEDDETEAASAGPYRLLGRIAPWGTNPLARTGEDGWRASAVERLAVLLRARDVPVGVTTDGRWWALVWAPRGGTTGAAVWDASLWSEEPVAFAAFVALLERARFLAAASADRLPALFAESLGRQEELTDSLSAQVREAVELLVATLDRLDADSSGALLAGVDEDELYSGVVTVMMRVIFLLFAEERRLLRSDADAYLRAYSVGRLVEQLEQRAALAGEQALEQRTGAWHRLLAVSRAVHGGVEHEDLRLPAYGGGLFDPDRHPWLEGRRRGDPGGAAHPPAVDDRTMLRLLRAVQYVEVAGERRRLTFRALDVEQIGYVYEGLLDLEVRTADEPVLHLQRPRTWPKGKAPSEVPATVAAAWADAPPATLVRELKPRTGMTPKRLQTALETALDAEDRADLAVRLGDDTVLIEIAANLAPLLRRDDRDRPVITRPGHRYLAPSTRRATTGTHYTPRWLAEDVAANTLEPLCYRPGPLETSDRDQWQPRPSSELLDLRVADIAMGSGAFLVAACRYLADRLVEAWDAEGRADATAVVRPRTGAAATSDVEVDAVLLQARRLVAEHCLYGVDINPLAVDMAKLSLWLVTMDDQRPFGFLDDRLVCGDSLLGLASWQQLEALHVDPTVTRRRQARGLLDYSGDWKTLLGQAADLRRRITAAPVEEIRDVEHKHRLLSEATALTDRLRVVADAITARGLTTASLPMNKRAQTRLDDQFETLRLQIGTALGDQTAEARLAKETDAALQDGRPDGTEPRRPLHWPLAFPEVFVDTHDPGFDAITGNPPFHGGQKLSGSLGADYLAWLQRWDGNAKKGSADLAARFVLRANRLLNTRGQLGFITTNTLVQGDTLEVGMLQAVDNGLTVRKGRSSHPWPSRSASLEIVNVWASRAPVASSGLRSLDDEEVPAIGADLEPVGRIKGRPMPLPENDGTAFIGTYVLGLGFTMAPDEAAALIGRDPRNAEVLQPYVIGQDLNQRPDTSASRWVINFRDWPLERAQQYPDLIDIVRRLVKPERDHNNRENYRKNWWQFGEVRPGMYRAIADLDYVLALSLVSNALMPLRVPTGQVIAHKCAVFALDGLADLAILSSNVHAAWVIRYTSTMRTDINYSPSDVFDTLPRPEPTTALEDLGRQLDAERRELMLARSWGLTTTYNHVHDPADLDPAVLRLREIHEAIDHAVLDAYGWDLDPQIGHHPTKIGTRWTVRKEARFELLDLLLEENHRRAGLL